MKFLKISEIEKFKTSKNSKLSREKFEMSPTLKLLTKTKDEMVPNMERHSMPAGSSIFQMIRREIEDEEQAQKN